MFKKKVKILFIDDNEPNNVLTQAIIDAEGFPIESFYAQSIDEAISMLYEFEKNKNFPKLIFCDIKLPVKDGYYFAKYYLEHFYENHKKVRVYFMSADFQQEQSDELTDFPFVYNVYTKPFSIEIFNDAVDEDDSNEPDDEDDSSEKNNKADTDDLNESDDTKEDDDDIDEETNSGS